MTKLFLPVWRKMAKHNFYNFLGSYNPAYKKAIIDNSKFQDFLENLKNFFKQIDNFPLGNDNLSEETYKDEFDKKILENLHGKTTHKGISNNDLIIAKNNKTKVIFEFKTPKNKNEMIQTEGNINKKALHEAIWYFYNQNSVEQSHDIINIVITDTEHFFFFNPNQFCNRDLEKICINFKEGQVAYTRTKDLYKSLENKIIEKNIQFDYSEFNLIQYKDKILNDKLNDNDKKQLKYLYKALHPDFLLREFSQKDSNELNDKFYKELLYILGLKEDGKNKKTIVSANIKGSLYDRICYHFGGINFDDAINLIIVWLNRILFLKLFESQLISFNNGDKTYAFLNSAKITSFAELNGLFFDILGKPLNTRENKTIPYLNSSLFERSELEKEHGNISNILNETIPLYKNSILKNYPKNPFLLKYLLDFLEAYSFSSNISENDNSKEIINSSVLGLIFEKLNGYIDGSFFTPGYITEYMSKSAIDNIVLKKYKEYNSSELCESIEDLKDIIQRDTNFQSRELRRNFYSEKLFDNLKICDPAVGSGHFLVSVLNYIISLKSYLNLLPISNKIDVLNDSLLIYADNEEIKQFEYKRNDRESLKIQKAIFDEKRKIIENCLFGVDINPNSVEICRLRLWIELLKNTYYIDNTDEMQTLPNIDINIKCGNSLISGYNVEIGKCAVDQIEDGRTFEAKQLKEYKNLVERYKKSNDKSIKEQIKNQIKQIKDSLFPPVQLNLFFDNSNNRSIYNNTLEWMIEFPEILDDNGIFQGFDIVIGNPPYFNVQTYGAKHEIVDCLKTKYSEIWMDKSDILFYFIKRAYELTKNNISFIVSNAFLFSDKARKLRNFLLKNMSISEIINFEKFMVFDSASITTCIISLEKGKIYTSTKIQNFKDKNIQLNDLYIELENKKDLYTKTFEDNKVFSLEDDNIKKINIKIDNNYKQLGDILKVGKGMETAANPVFCFKEYPKEFPRDFIKYRMSGEIISKYKYSNPNEYLLYYENIDNYNILPLEIQKYLENNENVLKNRATVKNEGHIWWKYSRPLHKEYYHLNKLWCSYRSDKNAFVYDDTNQFIGLTNTTVIFGTNNDYNLKYVLALLNSKLLNFRYKSIGKQTGNGIYEYFENQISKLPIPDITKEYQNKYVIMVDKILETMKSEDYSVNSEKQQAIIEYENQIDIMVYKLYNLTYDEVLLVDNDFSMTKEEYDFYQL